MMIVWCDLETSGMDPRGCHILEVAVSIADLASPFDAVPAYHAVLGMDEDDVTWLAQINPYVHTMHTKNGLIEECLQSPLVEIQDVETALLAIVPTIEDKEERPTLAGSSVHFDHGFIQQWMPTLASRLSHRHYDVSAVKLFCQSLGMEKPAKAEAHRAREDILESIAHAKRCAEWLVTNRPSGVP